MKYLENLDWERIKSDLQRGIKQGYVAVKKGAMVVRNNTEAMSEEGKRQYRIVMLKSNMHRSVSDLGAKVYELMRSKHNYPALDAQVRGAVARIKKMETSIKALENKPKTKRKKVTMKAA